MNIDDQIKIEILIDGQKISDIANMTFQEYSSILFT